jgi:DNA-3-methyladenine glycosylase II
VRRAPPASSVPPLSTFALTPRGPFSLAAAARFAAGFPGTDVVAGDDGSLAFAWAVDGDPDERVVAVRLRQAEPDGDVVGELEGAGDETLARAAARDVERILSLDVDGSGFADVLGRDPVVAAAQARAPGLRPVLFFTPLHAAAWAIASQRQRPAQATAALRALTEAHGERVGGLVAFPTPSRLAAIDAPVPGLPEIKLQRLRAVAAAAGDLTRDRLRALDPETVEAELLDLPGLGPFSAMLIQIRGVGDPDALPAGERRIERLVAEAYGADRPLAEVAEAWRPYRAWAAFLLRST